MNVCECGKIRRSCLTELQGRAMMAAALGAENKAGFGSEDQRGRADLRDFP